MLDAQEYRELLEETASKLDPPSPQDQEHL